MPSDPSIVVQYNLKTSGVITDNILQYSYSISVSAIRTRHQVSDSLRYSFKIPSFAIIFVTRFA